MSDPRPSPPDKPDNAPEACPGTQSEAAGKASSCAGCPNQSICASAPKGPDPDAAAIAARMATVKHKVLILSGKGGVGKSTFSAQLAFALAARGLQVGLLDVDICGPSIPRMLGLEGEEIHQSGSGWSPVYVDDTLGVMSIGFMLPDPDEAVIWRGPRKNGLIKQFLKDVDWGQLDYLVVDTPPGTSDEHISVVQLLREAGLDGAMVVTTPQEVALGDVRKEINFCKRTGLKVLGVVENMAGLQQGLREFSFRDGSGGDITEAVLKELEASPLLRAAVAATDVFYSQPGGVEAMAQKMEVPYFGKVPMDPKLSQAGEQGLSIAEMQGDSSAAPAIQAVVERLLAAADPVAAV